MEIIKSQIGMKYTAPSFFACSYFAVSQIRAVVPVVRLRFSDPPFKWIRTSKLFNTSNGSSSHTAQCSGSWSKKRNSSHHSVSASRRKTLKMLKYYFRARGRSVFRGFFRISWNVIRAKNEGWVGNSGGLFQTAVNSREFLCCRITRLIKKAFDLRNFSSDLRELLFSADNGLYLSNWLDSHRPANSRIGILTV
jgi:hypothetical protein